MKKSDELKNYFEELKATSLKKDSTTYGSGLWKKWHELADMQYEPAKEFFIERLLDVRASWRSESISLLGFHYTIEEDVLNKIRNMLISDLDSEVRITCATVLGKQSKFPEKSLVIALTKDSEENVVKAAFSALLELAEIPYKVKLSELAKVKSREIVPNTAEIKRILRECGKITEVEMI